MLRIVAVLIALGGISAASASAQGGTNHAALVVRFGDGTVQQRCVAFSEPSITGEELLNRSGFSVVMNYDYGMGGSVCSINGYGCAFPSQDCFCKCQTGTSCQYWAYYHWTGGAWRYASTGPSSYAVTNSALEGWSWGEGNFTSGTIPPAVTYDQICATSAPIGVPEPATVLLLASGLAGLAGYARLSRARRAAD